MDDLARLAPEHRDLGHAFDAGVAPDPEHAARRAAGDCVADRYLVWLRAVEEDQVAEPLVAPGRRVRPFGQVLVPGVSVPDRDPRRAALHERPP